MLLRITDAEKTIRGKVVEMGLNIPYTFDPVNFLDASVTQKGQLLSSNAKRFLLADTTIFDSRRAGPSRVSPTRYSGSLVLALYAKNANKLTDLDTLEGWADNFSEKTISGVRFRTFTPYTTMMYSGFAVLSGAIDFDFELYRGETP